MDNSRRERKYVPPLKAIAASLARLAIAMTVCGIGVIIVQYGDFASHKERKSGWLNSARVGWLGMSLAFWGLGEYYGYRIARKDRRWHDRIDTIERELKQTEQQLQVTQGRLVKTQELKVTNEYLLQENQYAITENGHLLEENQYAIAENQQLVQQNGHLNRELKKTKGENWHLRQALEGSNTNHSNTNYANTNNLNEDGSTTHYPNTKPTDLRIPLSRLTGISGKQAIAAIERLGFSRDRQTGDHVILKKHLNCTIPLKQELAPATLKNALRQAHIDPEEFLETLR